MTINAAGVQSLLLELLSTPSYAGEEEAVAALVEERLRAVGAEVTRDDAGAAFGGRCGNVIARLPGTVEAPALFFNAHLDTVGRTEELVPQIVDGVVRTNGLTVLGADCKAGVTAILEGVAAAVAAGEARPPLEIVFTVSEEVGLKGARQLDLSRFTAPFGFVFDSGTPIGEMTISAPFHAHQIVTVRGQAAHAGVCPEAGRSAIACAASAIDALPLGRIDHETTSNVGTIQGGQARNIVPAECRLECEVRSRERAKLDLVAAQFRTAFERAAEQHGCTVEFEHRVLYDGFRIALDEPAAQLAATAVRAAGLEPTYAEGGGGSDANVFCAGGLRCLVMACGEQQPHTPEECVAIQDVVDAARVVAELIRLGASRS